MANNDKDRYLEPIELDFIRLNHDEILKPLLIDYAHWFTEEEKGKALLVFLRHFAFNDNDEEIAQLNKDFPMAGMLFKFLDNASEKTQNNARWAAWQSFYKLDDSKSYDDIIKEHQAEKKAKKRVQNRNQYLKNKSRQQIDWGERLKEEQEKQDKLTQRYIEEYSEDIKKL